MFETTSLPVTSRGALPFLGNPLRLPSIVGYIDGKCQGVRDEESKYQLEKD